MYAAIAGLKTHMNKLNVLGNNIANVNTSGYKAQRTVFRDALYTTYSGGSDGTATTGGRNPSQIGYGSQVASIDLNMTTGTYDPGNPMDCMLYGDGFFMVGDKDIAKVIDAQDPTTFKSLKLTRVGDFKFGPDGYLVDGKGNAVYGFLTYGTTADGNPKVSDQLVPIRLPRMEKVIVNKKTGAEATEADAIENGKLKDDFEYSYKVRYPVVEDANNVGAGGNATAIRLEDYWPKDENGADIVADSNPLAFAQIDSISIDTKSGRISGTLKDTDQPITIGFLAIGNVTNPDGVTHEGESYYSCSAGAGDLQVSMLGGVASELGITHVNGSLAQDPNDPDADVELSRKAEIGSAGTTTLYTGGLEGSNVDLATEISEMIKAQRGYQANTRIITVTDSMLEELVNMKR